jgi:hypothetical protein
MRLELDKQPLLEALLTHLQITRIADKPSPTVTKAYLRPFSSYSSPTSQHDPKYDLRPEETGKTPLELFKLALLRIVLRLDLSGSDPSAAAFLNKKLALEKEVTLAAATQQPADVIFDQWMKELNDDDYWVIQTLGEIRIVRSKGETSIDQEKNTTAPSSKIVLPLYSMGFWNLLSDYLSHDAITNRYANLVHSTT